MIGAGEKMRMIIGISGASGAIYGIRLLQVLSTIENVETHLVISKAGEMTIHHETDWDINDVKKLADYHYNISDIGATLSSGSFKRDGMIIAPCSMKTLSALSNSYTDNLITRAGDVTLKEKGKLVLLIRDCLNSSKFSIECTCQSTISCFFSYYEIITYI